MFKRIYSSPNAGLDLLRLVVCAIIFTHGAYRFLDGTTPVLGEILEDEGFPHGLLLASLVNLAETAGTLLLALRLLVWPVALILSLIYFTGIVLFHSHNGFFVVGPGEGGWEYSVLLITCLFATMWANQDRKLI